VPDEETPPNTPIQLRQYLAMRFNREELRTLCSELGIEYENLPDAKDSMVRELVAHCERKQCIPELIEACRRPRQNVSWEDRPRLTVRPKADSPELPTSGKSIQIEEMELPGCYVRNMVVALCAIFVLIGLSYAIAQRGLVAHPVPESTVTIVHRATTTLPAATTVPPTQITLPTETLGAPTSTPRYTPTPAPTSPPRTPTPTPVATSSTLIYPAPTLMSPRDGETVRGAQGVDLIWAWNGTLHSGERFRVRITWPGGAMEKLTEGTFLSTGQPPGSSDTCQWKVDVVRVDSSGRVIQVLSGPSDSWQIKWQ